MIKKLKEITLLSLTGIFLTGQAYAESIELEDVELAVCQLEDPSALFSKIEIFGFGPHGKVRLTSKFGVSVKEAEIYMPGWTVYGARFNHGEESLRLRFAQFPRLSTGLFFRQNEAGEVVEQEYECEVIESYRTHTIDFLYEGSEPLPLDYNRLDVSISLPGSGICYLDVVFNQPLTNENAILFTKKTRVKSLRNSSLDPLEPDVLLHESPQRIRYTLPMEGWSSTFRIETVRGIFAGADFRRLLAKISDLEESEVLSETVLLESKSCDL